ncbi:SDR family oxidoreductase [Micromonospora sp. NBC_01740]|uniref:SDR family oxidoreductase n=1 Tax=Micromonospora sp. NBC_01740 TaxID=2975986 RepID=UPI002E0D92D8|nr:SDR family oxidoreductase [Micromonospora sp. NBC_01740]
MRLDGKVAVVTGAARGLGRACAVAYADEGAALVLTDVAADIDGVPYPLGSLSQLEHTAELCRDRGAPVLVRTADLRSTAQVQQVVSDTMDRFGRADVLVNCAGIAAPSGQSTQEITEAQWLLMIDVDLNGAWRMIRATAPGMLAQRAGSIINVSSTAGLVGYRNFAAYVAAKHGLIGLTRAAALDFAPLKVRVNALCPGSVRDSEPFEGRMLSEIARSLDVAVADHEETFLQGQPMNSLVEPEDVASAALWLASDESQRVTGSVVTVDGGFTSR